MATAPSEVPPPGLGTHGSAVTAALPAPGCALGDQVPTGAAAGVVFFKFTLCQGSNAGREGWGEPVGCLGGYFFLWDMCILIFFNNE